MAQTTIRPEQIRTIPVELYRNINLLNVGSVIKNSPGKLVAVDFRTTVAGERYIKLYNKDTAPTFTDPVRITFTITNATPATFILPADMEFDLGIGIRAVTGIADNNNTAPAANTVFVNVWYY